MPDSAALSPQQRIAELLASIVARAEYLAEIRCPYQNVRRHCTAGFGCPFQERTGSSGLIRCTAGARKGYMP